MSAGGRVFYNGMFNINKTTWSARFENEIKPYISSLYDNHGFGIGGFFDATYVEIGIDLIFGSFKPNNSVGYADDFEMKSTQFGFSILGKYPFTVGKLAVFPLLGIDYQIFISGEADGHTYNREDLYWKDLYDAFSIVAGIGLDYKLTGKLYLRGGLLLNFKTDSSFDTDFRAMGKKSEVHELLLFTFGPRVSIGVGYKLGAAGGKEVKK
jgi:hypothetical protein